MTLNHTFARFFVIILVITTAACDSTEPRDEDDDVFATRAALTLINETVPDTVSWSAEATSGLVDGIPFTQDTLVLTAGMSFSGRIEFFNATNSAVTGRIRGEAERYQIFYEVSDLDDVRIIATDTETDYGSNQHGINLRVGLAFTFTTPSVESPLTGSVRVKVGYFPAGQKNGFTLTVDPLYDFIIPVRVVPQPQPKPPESALITAFRLDLERVDDLKRISITAARPDGLDLDGEPIPDEHLEIEICERPPGDVVFVCSAANELTVYRDEHYTGFATVSDPESGDAYTDHVWANQEIFRIFYEFNFAPTGLTLNMDANALPVGLELDWQLPDNIQIGGGRMTFRMFEYDPQRGGDKARFISTAKLMDFRITFNLDR